MIVLVIVTVEGLAALALYVAERRHPGQVLDLFLENHFASLTPDELRNYRDDTYDARLGWDYRPGTAFDRLNSGGETYVASFAADGSRRHGPSPRPAAVAAYGDSFTAGVGVNDDETWAYVLEQMLDRGVKNFGTGGFGTDQAVMKFEGHLQSGIVAPVTILGIHEENIRRIVNTFRPFYIRQTGIELGFKPRYRCDQQGTLHPEANPLMSFDSDPEALEEVAARAAENDMYAQHMLRFSPPFLPKLIRALGDLARYRMDEPSWLDPGTLNLWADPEASYLMTCIVRHFVRLAERNGSTPVVLFIPKDGEPRSFGGPAPAYTGFIERLREQEPGLVVVDVSTEDFDPERFLNVRYSGHPSPYGNQVIAEAVGRAVRPLLDPLPID